MAAQTSEFGGLTRPQGSLDSSPLAPYRGALDERSAAHLLRRAGFGGTPNDIRRYAAMTPGDAVETLIRFPSTANLPAPADVYSPMSLYAQYGGPKGIADLPADQKKALRKQVRDDIHSSLASLELWWLNRMLQTPAPLQEKMTLLYHGHFTSAIGDKGVSAVMMQNQQELFRTYALGNLRELTRAVSKDPAMLRYLDGSQNVATHPNENYARELMELFTLGVDNYTENDVRESARAWTGWRWSPVTERAWFAPAFHDNGSKTILGRTGNFDGDDVVDIIFAQPQCAKFFAGWLLNNFVYNDPEPELVDGVAALLQKHDFELAPVMSALLRSNVFYSERAYRALVKSPAEFVVGVHKALGIKEIGEQAVPALAAMGQWLYYPPNVAGWPGGANWLTSSTIIARENYLARAIDSQAIAQSSWLNSLPMKPGDAAHTMLASILQDDAAPASAYELEGFLAGNGSAALGALSPENYGERVSGAAYLALSMPAFQLG